MGWNGSAQGNATLTTSSSGTGARPAHPPSRGLVKGLLALLLIAALGGAVAWWFVLRSSQDKVEDDKGGKPGLIAEVTPHKVAHNVAKIGKEDVPAPEPPPEEKPKKDLGTVFVARTAKDGQVMTLMDGTVVTNYPPKPIFKRDLERSLQVALRPGGMSRALLQTVLQRHTESEIIAMLREMTIPNDDDPENVKNIKNGVQDLKEKILLEVQDGRSVADVFGEISRTCSQENAIRVAAMKARAEAVRSGDAAMVRETVATANEMLKKSGLPAMSVPEQFKDQDLSEGDADLTDAKKLEVDDGFVPEN